MKQVAERQRKVRPSFSFVPKARASAFPPAPLPKMDPIGEGEDEERGEHLPWEDTLSEQGDHVDHPADADADVGSDATDTPRSSDSTVDSPAVQPPAAVPAGPPIVVLLETQSAHHLESNNHNAPIAFDLDAHAPRGPPIIATRVSVSSPCIRNSTSAGRKSVSIAAPHRSNKSIIPSTSVAHPITTPLHDAVTAWHRDPSNPFDQGERDGRMVATP
jgi:hypothetical protein